MRFDLPLLVLLAAASSVHAQVPGAGNDAISELLAGEIQAGMNRQLIANRVIGNMLMSQMIQGQLRAGIGRGRIDAGQATTRFERSQEASTLSQSPPGATPEADTRTMAAAREALREFETQLSARGYRTDDVADAQALAFVMSYAACKGEDPGPERLEKLRQRFRDNLLTSEYWQSLSDAERQAEYESLAIPAVLAVAARSASAAADTTAEQREAFARLAVELATPVLDHFIDFPVECLELTPDGVGDRSERLVRLGLGTTTFARVEPFITVHAYATHWDYLRKPEGHWERAIGRFDAIVRALGGEINDIADANAAAFAVHYYVQTEGRVELSLAQVRWVRAEMRKDVLGSVGFQRMGDAERQRLYEQLALDAIRVRDDYIEQERVLAERQPEGHYEAIVHINNQRHARDRRRDHVAGSLARCREIFRPRKLEELVLVERGFVPIGASAPITHQPAPVDAPAVAAFGARSSAATPLSATAAGQPHIDAVPEPRSPR